VSLCLGGNLFRFIRVRELLSILQKKSFNRIGIYIIFVGVLLTLTSGCSRQTKYKILTFFFTGVPPLGEEKKPVKKIDTSEVKKKKVEKVVLYSHTPWASGKCDQCHKNAVSFRMPGQKKAPTVFHKGGGMPGKLIWPKKELCTQCHDDKSKSKAYAKGLYLHPTSAEGDCYACHDPHQSKNPHMLLEKPKNICVSCHLDEEVLDPADVCKPDDCLSCHNPHMGKDRLLLTRDFKEVPEKVTFDGEEGSASGSASSP